MTCGKNQVFKVQTECPKTCLNPDGNYDCGPFELNEDCYCDSDFVLINGECLPKTNCGCQIDNLGIILNVFKNYF